MSSIVYLKNKSNGRVYAYLNESKWDSGSGKCRCKRKCLGHVDPVTGDIVPNKGKKDPTAVSVRTVGVSKFLEMVSEKIGLTQSLKAAFPDHWKLILSSMFYTLREPENMSRIRYWSLENETPFKKQITEKDLLSLFPEITENALFLFYRNWRDRFESDDFFMFHVTSISSFDRRMETIRFNDLPNISVKPEMFLSMTIDQKSGLPVTFDLESSLPVNYTDIRRCESTQRWLDFHRIIQILDMDYCDNENLTDLLNTGHRFIIRASPQFEFARDSIKRVEDRIMDLSNYITIDGEPFFVMSFVNYINGRKCFVHIYFSPDDAEKEFSLLLSLIETCEKEMKNNIYVKEHEAFYDRYFIRHGTKDGGFIEKNGEAIMSYNDVAGFVVLMSNTVKNPAQAFHHYFTKSRMQKSFDNLQNERDRTDLKLYSDTNYRGLLFIRFLAYILYSEISNRIRSYSPTSDMTFTSAINEMSAMKKVTIGDKPPIFTQVNPVQAKILRAFGINISELG